MCLKSAHVLCLYTSFYGLTPQQDDDVTRGVVNDVIQLNWTHTQQHDQYKKVIAKVRV